MRKLASFLLNFIFKFTKIQENKILFESGRGKVDGNPLAVYRYIKSNCPKRFKTIWLVEKGTDVSSLNKGDYFYYKTFKGYYHLATSKYWIRSQSFGSLLNKRKDQVYIQLWHGAGALKKMGYDVNDEVNRPPMQYVKDWDYYIASDPYGAKIMRSSTGYNKEILTLGMARFDLIKNASKEYINKIKKHLNIEDNKKMIVLYAPTFRDYELKENKLDLKINNLANSENILLMLRVHPLVNNKLKDTKFNDNILNVSDYPDINDLLLITDVLISDYSGTIFDFALLQRPILFYAYDYDKYVNCRGGFYLDYKKDLPGPIAYTEEQLISTVNNIDKIKSEYKEKLYNFNEKYNKYSDGLVCKKIVDRIIDGTFKSTKDVKNEKV